MTRIRTSRKTLAAALLAALGLFVLAGVGRAEDPSARDVNHRLLPRLRSDDDAERQRAEKELFALGASGRTELERIAAGDDRASAATALKLPERTEWTPAEKEVPLESAGEDREDAPPTWHDLLRRAQKDLDAWHRRLVERLPRSVEIDLSELRRAGRSRTSSGRIVEDGRSLAWEEAADGKLKVTVKDGPDAEEKVYEAASMDELRKAAPEVAERLEKMRGGHVLRLRIDPGFLDGILTEPWVDRWPETPEFERFRESMERALQRMRRFRKDRALDTERTALRPRRLLGIEWVAPSPALRSHLDLKSGGLLVTKVHPDTSAERLGLKRHDVLVTLAGKPLRQGKDVHGALESLPEGETLKATVLRKGQRLDLATKR